MHQAAATYWNQIAEQQPLVTEWAQQMFPLPQDQMDRALGFQEQRLDDQGVDPEVASAYLKVMPLLWERKAISNFLLDNPSLRIAMPPQETLREAVMTARNDFQMTTTQVGALVSLLRRKPTMPRDTRRIVSDRRPRGKERP